MTLNFDCQFGYRDGFELHAAFETNSTRTTLFGPSGSGKTTILELIAGTLQPDEGCVSFGGRTLFDSSQCISLLPEQRRIGYVFQDPLLFPHMSILDNLKFGQRFRKDKEDLIEVGAVAEVLGLNELLDRSPASLSGGEQQRVALGRALASAPELLLMDEPVSSLDHDLKYSVLSYLKAAIAEWNVPVIYVTHSKEEQQFLGGDVLTVIDGRLGKPAQ